MDRSAFQEFADTIDACVILVDKSGRIEAVNNVTEETIGQSSSPILGIEFAELAPPTERHTVRSALQRMFEDGGFRGLEARHTDSSGASRLLCWSLQRIEFASENSYCGILTGTESTERRNLEDKLNEYTMIVNSMGEAIVRVDRNRIIMSCNPAAELLYGYSEAELVGQPNTLLTANSVALRHLDFSRKVDATGEFQRIETRRRRKDGTEFDIDFRVSPLYDETGALDGWVSIGTDITERKRMEAELRKAAENDPLTGLYNRGQFMKLAQQEAARAKRYDHDLSLILCDLDHFKAVNDSFGHAGGDEVLRRFAQLGTEELRTDIDLFGRVGGEEFAILLPETGAAAAADVAERLRRKIGLTPVSFEFDEIYFSGSFGVAPCQQPAVSIEETMQRADEALYEAKDKGRNRVEIANR